MIHHSLLHQGYGYRHSHQYNLQQDSLPLLLHMNYPSR
jgi:hypothetical protein